MKKVLLFVLNVYEIDNCTFKYLNHFQTIEHLVLGTKISYQ
jgi:hypothetical protein